MEDRETPRMRKYGESKTTRIMMATVPHVISGSGQKISGQWIFIGQSVQDEPLALKSLIDAASLQEKQEINYENILTLQLEAECLSKEIEAV